MVRSGDYVYKTAILQITLQNFTAANKKVTSKTGIKLKFFLSKSIPSIRVTHTKSI